MSRWRAIVPFKTAGGRKTRLAPALSPAERDRLAQAMYDRVIAVLRACPSVAGVAVLSETPPTDADLHWLRDAGRGLNAELQALTIATPRLVIHADLPLLAVEDVEALLAAAGNGGAIAPDRHGVGVNALALEAALSVAFRFGPDSLAAHRRQLGERLAVVERPGLALDVDTPEDLTEAIRRGFHP